MEILTYYLAPPFFALFLYSLYPVEFSKLVLKIMLTVSTIFILTVLVTKARVFSSFMNVHHIYTLLCCIYALYCLILCLIRKREGAHIILIGFIILFTTTSYDIFDHLKDDQSFRILPFGVMGFIFSLTMIVAFRFTNAFRTIEIQHKELTITSEKYRNE